MSFGLEILAWEVGGIALGVVLVRIDEWRDRREMRRFWLATRPGPMSTKLPTATELIIPVRLLDVTDPSAPDGPVLPNLLP